MNVYSTSEVRTYQRCREEHRIAYGLKVRAARQSYALRFGDLIHKSLEAWWTAPPVDALRSAMESLESMAREEPFEWARASAMMAGYHARWAPDRHRYEVIGVEKRFSLVRDGYAFAGKLDLFVRELSTGRMLLGEHKTTSEDIAPGSDYWARLIIDDQVSNYFAASRTLGYDVSGCIYDVLRKPSLKPYEATPVASRKYTKQGALYANQRADDETVDAFLGRCVEEIAENPDRYYQRVDVVRLAHEEERARSDLMTLVRDMERMDPGVPEPRNPQSCKRYGSMCPYAPVCLGQTNLHDSRYRAATSKHEEL